MADHPADTVPLAERVAHLWALHGADDHAAVAREAGNLLERYPENRDLHLLAASSLRFLGQPDAALAALDRLAVLQPHYSLMHQERGLCHVARRDAPQAISALLEAVRINPALPMAWKILEGLWRMTGDPAGAERAAEHRSMLASLPPPIVRATALYGDADLVPAEAIVRRYLLDHGDHPEGMRLLAKIGVDRDVLDDAETLYAGVLSLAPDHRAARSEYVQVLIARHKFGKAREALAPLIAQGSDHPDHLQQSATIAVGLGEHDQAIALYRRLIAALPPIASDRMVQTRAADLYLWLAHALKTIGQVTEAIETYRKAAAIRPDFGDAYWSLANLKTYRFTDAEIAAIRAGEHDPATSPDDRIQLAFALGKALEDRGDYEGSWAAYARGNAAQRAQSKYRPDIFETNTREQKRVCTPAFFAARTDWGDPSPDPIFVLGLPRSGSTLIEQILASHSQVEGTQELPDIPRIALDLQGRDPDLDAPLYPGSLEHLDQGAVRALGERYMQETRIHRALGRAFFIDKMPNNFRHIGLIHLILPKARIIDARRNPMDCCFSNLKQLFAQGQEFTYSIEDIARYYRTYLDLMRHWDTVLPGKVLRLVNEDLIADPEGQIRRLLDHCGLPFEESCLNFHQTRRSVRTPSSEQVRRPISRDGIDQWRPFEPWLLPLREALGDVLENWRN